MPAKSKSPEAAQRKVWKAELKQFESAGRKVTKDYDREVKRLNGEITKARNALGSFQLRAGKRAARELLKIRSRIAVLRGRLGL